MDYTFTWGEGPEDVGVETSGAIDVDALDAMVEEVDPPAKDVPVHVDENDAGRCSGDEPLRRERCRGGRRNHDGEHQRRLFSASFSRCFVVSTPSKRSPCCSTRRRTTSIV